MVDLSTHVGPPSSSGTTAKSKLNLYWSGRAYTQNDNWHYLSSIWGTSYNLLNSNFSRNTLGDFSNGLPVNTYPAVMNPGFTSPIDGVIKSVLYSFHGVSGTFTGTIQFGLIHGTIDTNTSSSTVPTTNINIGSNGESATGNDTALEITITTPQHRYIVSKEGINHSVKKGDMIMVACRRTTDAVSTTIQQLCLSVNIVIEEE
jgi:hypothetical protein